MEELKPLSKLLELDERMCGFPWMIESGHQRLAEINLAKNVPEDIKNYFVTIKNLCLYGQFVYTFYGVAESLTYLLIEFALRERFNAGKTGRKGDFRQLLRKAIEQGLLKEEGFSHVRRLREWGEERQGFFEVTGTYLKILEEKMPCA